MRLAPLLLAAALGGCIETTGPAPGPASGRLPAEPPRIPTASAPAADRIPASQAAANFRAVVARVEPVAEEACRAETRGTNCDFKILVDTRRSSPPNAMQTVDRDGRPIIGFTLALIADARNQDELAFVLGHEAAHHIAGHIPETRRNAAGGAILGTLVGAAIGADQQTAQQLGRLGGTVAGRAYAKSFELEADDLGARIALRAGYDPVRGAEFFNRIPDPGDRFLGTHPPNRDRIATVRRAVGR